MLKINSAGLRRPARAPRLGYRRKRPLARILLAALLVASGCSRSERPDIVLITFDTTRYDRLGFNGDPEARTPRLDAVASDALVFDRAYAATGLTLPVHTSILTGLEPFEHGVHTNGRFRVPAEAPTLAITLGRAGYRTGAFVSAYVLNGFYGLNRGFDIYSDETHDKRAALDFSVPSRPGEEVVDDAVEWLGSLDDHAPVFLWAHFYDPHRPWTVAPGFEEAVDEYAAEISYADNQFGRLLDTLRRRDRPLLLVFTADHGEGLGEHGEMTHGVTAYDAVLHVPLFFYGYGFDDAGRSDVLARHVDIVPTILARIGITADPELRGTDLLQAASGEQKQTGPPTGFFQSMGPYHDHGWAALEGIRTARWKYTATPEPEELYDTQVDREETGNLLDRDPAKAREMEDLYRDYIATGPRYSVPLQSGALDLEQLQQLAALGYIGVGSEAPESSDTDPRKFVRIFRWIDAARAFASAGDYAASIEALTTMAGSDSVKPLVLRSLAPVLTEAGQWDEAIDAWEEYLAISPTQDGRAGLADALVRAGRYNEALELLQALDGGSTKLLALKARALLGIGNREEAIAAVDRSLAENATRELWAEIRAEILIADPPPEGAEEEFEEILRRAPGAAAAMSWFGYYLTVLRTDPDPTRGSELLAAAADLMPEDEQIGSNLAWGLYRSGNRGDALAVLEPIVEANPSLHLERFRLADMLVARDGPGDRQRARTLIAGSLRQWPGAPWAADAQAILAGLQDRPAEEGAP